MPDLEVTRPWSFDDVIGNARGDMALISGPDRRLIDEALNLYKAILAGMAYCNALRGRAEDGAYTYNAEGTAAVARGEDLDTLFEEWLRKAEEALNRVRGEVEP